MSLLGIDLGTSGVRVAAFTIDGTEIASRTTTTRLAHDSGGVVETDAEEILAAVESSLRALTVDDRLRADPITALALSVQGEAIVPVDGAGRALAHAPLSMDRRGVAAAEWMTRRLGGERLKRITGQPVHPMFSIYKVAYEGNETSADAGAQEANTWAEAAAFRCLGDFVAVRLGAEPAIDYSMASRTGAFDIDSRTWSNEIFAAAAEYAGDWITPAKFSRPVPSGCVIGTVSDAAAARTGLIAGTTIVAGSHDQASSFVGGGGQVGKTSVFAFGSSDCLSVGTSHRPTRLDDTGFATYPLNDALWITLAGTAAGGWALAWFADLVGAQNDSEVNALYSTPAIAPPRLLVLPYFAGSGTLDNDPAAHGVIAGLTLSTSRAELSRAFLEASGFELAKMLDALAASDIDAGSVMAVGGGARNHVALAIRAQAAGVPLTGIAGHASARGAALTAGIGVGTFGGFDSLPSPVSTAEYVPDPHTQAWYDSQRSTFRALYQVSRPINVALSTPKENHKND